LNPIDLDAARAAIDRAYTEIGEVAKEGPARRWRMSIPAQPGRDSDLLIAGGLDAGRLAIDELRVARTQLGWVRVLLDAAPLWLTGAAAGDTLFQIRQALTESDQEGGEQATGP